MKTIDDVLLALSRKYDGPTKEIRGFTYIPWNDTAKAAIEVFGPLGWSNEIITLKEDEGGYSCIMRVTVQVYDPARQEVIRVTRDGVGYGEIQKTRDGRELRDTAIKAAASDALSRAFKLLGDAFGLFLYEKEEDAAPTASVQKKQQAGSDWRTEEFGARVLSTLKRNKVPEGAINRMSWEQAKQAVGLLLEQKLSTEQVLKQLGFSSGDRFSELF